MGPRFGTLIWDTDLGGDMGPQYGTLIWYPGWGVIWDLYLGPWFRAPLWDPDLGGDMGLRFGTLIWDPDLGPWFGGWYGTSIWDPDLGGYLGGDMRPQFWTLIWMPNVISQIKQNSSDINEIILAPCDHAMSLATLNKILVIWMKLYWRPAMQVMYKVILV
jgi:hypothetical protein